MKKTILILFAITMAFTLSACSSKDPITAEDFINTMEQEGYTITDATGQFDADFVDSVSIAHKDGHQIEFYVLNSEDRAVAAFNENKAYFEQRKGNVSTEKSVSVSNYGYYTLTTGESYCVVSRIGNTFVYADVPKELKDEVGTLIQGFGY